MGSTRCNGVLRTKPELVVCDADVDADDEVLLVVVDGVLLVDPDTDVDVDVNGN